jgi:hypothetical protein
MERRINLLFIFFAASVFFVNIGLATFRGEFNVTLLTNIFFFVPFIGVAFFLVIHQMKLSILQISHVIFLAVVAAIAILDDYNSIYGLGFALLAIYLAQKYGFFYSSHDFENNVFINWNIVFRRNICIGRW